MQGRGLRMQRSLMIIFQQLSCLLVTEMDLNIAPCIAFHKKKLLHLQSFGAITHKTYCIRTSFRRNDLLWIVIFSHKVAMRKAQVSFSISSNGFQRQFQHKPQFGFTTEIVFAFGRKYFKFKLEFINDFQTIRLVQFCRWSLSKLSMKKHWSMFWMPQNLFIIDPNSNQHLRVILNWIQNWVENRIYFRQKKNIFSFS